MDKHKKNEEYTLLITDIGNNGEGIGHLEDGYTLFVAGGVVGDTICARIIKAQKNYGIGRLISIITPSPDRVAAACPVSGRCGGCQISSLSYEKQLELKSEKVRSLLTRIGGFDAGHIDSIFHDIIGFPSSFPEHFRNKAQYPVGTDTSGRTVIGFYSLHSHRIIPIDSCLIGAESDAPILKEILAFMDDYHITAYDETTGKGLVRHILLRTAYATGEVMVCLVINGRTIPEEKKLISRLTAISLPLSRKITSICTSSNTSDTNVIMGNSYHVSWGNGYITDKIADISFRISPLSFYQVNPVQTERLYSCALSAAALTGNETVWDLYCGIGTISLFMARSARHVYGVEIIPQAIDNANENALINDITNATFIVGKAEEVLPAFYASSGDSLATHPDVIVVDPPRKGCDTDCLTTILQMAPERIVYVSCDPATLARDLKILCNDSLYSLQSVTPVDMFPNSVHVETVVLLSDKKVDGHISIDLDVEKLKK